MRGALQTFVGFELISLAYFTGLFHWLISLVHFTGRLITMPRSIKVHTGYVDTIRIAVRRNGFQTQRALAERAGYSLATVKKFLGGKPVDFATFTELCETLNTDWETIADLGDGSLANDASGNGSPAKRSPAHPPTNPPASPPTDDPLADQAADPVSPVQAQKSAPQDWGAAVDVSIFYGRKQTLATLEDWIVRDRTRLVALCGIGGIGKTTLTAKLAHSIANHFDYL
ncbi:MAG: helix-turn-helix transcriptional regulator, partial [Cyanobacteria bacterium P01_A01_bin.116]